MADQEESWLEVPPEFQRPTHEGCGGYLRGLGRRGNPRRPIAVCSHCRARVRVSGEALRQIRKADNYEAQKGLQAYIRDPYFYEYEHEYYEIWGGIEDEF